MIRKCLAFIYHLILWTAEYPSKRKLHIMFDYLKLHRRKGLNMNEYYQFEMESRSEKFRQDFLGENEQRLYLDWLNPVKYYVLARNKFMAHKMLENTGIRKSPLYCYYQPTGRLESTEIANDLAGVCRILQSKQVTECVIKTTESSHGDNVWVIRNITFSDDDAVLERFDGQQLKLSEVLGSEPLLFEGLIRQTQQFAAFNPSSVNTVRFMTALYPDGTARVIATFIKIGRAGKCVDNAGGGGNVDVCVDTETGTIQYAIQYDGWRHISDIDCHPDSGAQLNGVVIDNWQQIKDEVLRFQQAFPYCKAAGWDIAITDDGPVVIEVNDMWDRTGQYFIRRGWRNDIRDCYRAWEPFGYPTMGRLENRLSPQRLNKIIHSEQ